MTKKMILFVLVTAILFIAKLEAQAPPSPIYRIGRIVAAVNPQVYTDAYNANPSLFGSSEATLATYNDTAERIAQAFDEFKQADPAVYELIMAKKQLSVTPLQR